MKRRNLGTSRVEKLHAILQRESRQEDHPLVGSVTPAPPPDARWQVSEWCRDRGAWKHFGYAANDPEKQSLAAQIRALGGKIRYKPIVPGSETTRIASESSTSGREQARRDPKSADGRTQSGAEDRRSVEYKAIVLSSLTLWIEEVRRAELVAELPIEQIMAARDTCMLVVKQRGMDGLTTQRDPLARYESYK